MKDTYKYHIWELGESDWSINLQVGRTRIDKVINKMMKVRPSILSPKISINSPHCISQGSVKRVLKTFPHTPYTKFHFI